MSEPMTVYRMSMRGDGRSMWYTRDGIFQPIVPEVEALPMPTDVLRLDVGSDWLSGVSDPTLLELWFPGLVGKLTDMGFVTRKYMAVHWIDLPNEVVFDLSTAMEATND